MTRASYESDPTLADLKREIHAMDGKLSEEDDVFRAALVLLGPAVTGVADPKLLATFLRLPEPFVRECWDNLVRAGIFTPEADGFLCFEPTNDWVKRDEDSAVCFWLDVCVAKGTIEVIEQEPERRFRITAQGQAEVEALATIAEWDKQRGARRLPDGDA